MLIETDVSFSDTDSGGTNQHTPGICGITNDFVNDLSL